MSGTPREPRRGAPRGARLQAGARARLERVHQLRDLVHDHLGPRRDASRPSAQAWNNGGPIAISIGWPIICVLVLLVAFSMSELTSAYPDRRRPLLVGGEARRPGLELVHRLVQHRSGWSASSPRWTTGGELPEPSCSTSRASTSSGINFADTAHLLTETFAALPVILAPVRAGQHLRRTWSGAVQQHLGLLARVRRDRDHRDPRLRPRPSPERRLRLHARRINNSGFTDGATAASSSGSSCCPSASCSTMYTQTGYDASAHTAEETKDAAMSAAKGVWQSVALSALIGWFVLLALIFAATDVKGDQRRRRLRRRRSSPLALSDGLGGDGDPDHRHRRPALLRHGRR